MEQRVVPAVGRGTGDAGGTGPRVGDPPGGSRSGGPYRDRAEGAFRKTEGHRQDAPPAQVTGTPAGL